MATKVKEPKNHLQALFLKRVQDEMNRLGLSRNGVAARVGGPAQRTFNDIMNGADPRLSSVHEIATALGVQPWQLFIEKSDLRKYSAEVKNFPAPGAMIGKPFPRKKSGDIAKSKA